MLHIIIGTNSDTRKEKRTALFDGGSDVVFLDDSVSSFGALVEYAYPSLFSLSTPIVHGKYLLEKKDDELKPETILTLVLSPTIFILEEMAMNAPIKKQFEKQGAHLHEIKEIKKASAGANTIFSVTNAITAQNKKDRWMAYQASVKDHAPEALIGILFWKLRQLLDTPSKQTEYYRTLYGALMDAQRRAWQRGFPLSLAIEKVLLEI